MKDQEQDLLRRAHDRDAHAVYSAQSPQAGPVRPSWKNMLMIAIIARRPFLIFEFNYFLRSSSS